MTKLHKLMSNLRYVTVDSEAARGHWWDMVEMAQYLSPDMYRANRQMIVENKATAGILSHKRTRGFFIYMAKERRVIGRAS